MKPINSSELEIKLDERIDKNDKPTGVFSVSILVKDLDGYGGTCVFQSADYPKRKMAEKAYAKIKKQIYLGNYALETVPKKLSGGSIK